MIGSCTRGPQRAGLADRPQDIEARHPRHLDCVEGAKEHPKCENGVWAMDCKALGAVKTRGTVDRPCRPALGRRRGQHVGVVWSFIDDKNSEGWAVHGA